MNFAGNIDGRAVWAKAIVEAAKHAAKDATGRKKIPWVHA